MQFRTEDGVELVDAKEACRILGGSRPINHATLYRGIADGRFPAPSNLGEALAAGSRLNSLQQSASSWPRANRRAA